MDAQPRWGSAAAINPNEVVHRQNPLVFFVTFVVHFRVSRPSLHAPIFSRHPNDALQIAARFVHPVVAQPRIERL